MIDRFQVPDPDFAPYAETHANRDFDGPLSVSLRMEKRFRSSYKRLVQYR
ncbi:unnamed protein product [Protopolystoma xenopodis]|uniref:Uncharacterized protein n=1 Tax=Protopolystoma xenopodis TaxID=117903 RepID=A0A448XPJ7_9PLAT|nr:unnamed protein product [Protopolystoma xenopodis]